MKKIYWGKQNKEFVINLILLSYCIYPKLYYTLEKIIVIYHTSFSKSE